MIVLFRTFSVGIMVAIFVSSSQSRVAMPVTFSGADKLVHLAVYGVLAFCLLHSFTTPYSRNRRFGWATLVAVLYGISDEIHQSFVPGRDASVADIVADGTGAVLVEIITFKRLRGKG